MTSFDAFARRPARSSITNMDYGDFLRETRPVARPAMPAARHSWLELSSEMEAYGARMSATYSANSERIEGFQSGALPADVVVPNIINAHAQAEWKRHNRRLRNLSAGE